MHFSSRSCCIVYGTHLGIVQNMLDYDFLCGRGPSVKAIFSAQGEGRQFKVFFGKQEMFIPSVHSWEEVDQFDNVDTLINLASFRSASVVNKEAIVAKKFRQIFVIAEAIAERETREVIALAKQYDVSMFGPSIVGGIIVGVFRIGHTGGSLDNIIKSKLYKAGSVGIVSKSGGMMNELCHVVSKVTDGVHTALQVGGDRYPMTSFGDVLHYFESVDEIKLVVMLGEVGNRDELMIANMIKKKLTKPLVAWCIGESAEAMKTQVQFGHAGAKANHEEETASYKNTYMKDAGIFVPDSYDEFAELIGEVYKERVKAKNGKLCHPECNEGSGSCNKDSSSGRPPTGRDKTPQNDNKKAPQNDKKGRVCENVGVPKIILEKIKIMETRKKTIFSSTISDERGEELLYDGIPVTDFVQQGSLARVIGHLWLKRELPDYALRFIDTVLILLADHGPAVCGAHNAIVTARAGKDVVTSLIAGLTTIGPLFGGAIDEAGMNFFRAVRDGLSAEIFVENMKKSGSLIAGIGHKVKSKYNPDKRCEVLASLVGGVEQSHCHPECNEGSGSCKKDSSTPPGLSIQSGGISEGQHMLIPVRKHYEFAKQVEVLTLVKKTNLILNVDGHVAALLLDIFVSMGMSDKEIEECLHIGIFNALFVLARSIGFIGHILDQKRLKEGLYRTPWEDIWYGE